MIPRRAGWFTPVLLACHACAAPPVQLDVERAVLSRAIGGAPAALYLTVRSSSAIALAISDVTVDGARSAVIQTTAAHRRAAGDVAGGSPLYERVDSVPVGAGQSVRFAPGGYFVAVADMAQPVSRGDSVRITLRVTTGAIVRARAVVLDYADLDTALVPPDQATARAAATASADEGRLLYRANGCASCHGRDGHGDGPVGATLQPPPRDFRRADLFRNGNDESSIAQTLATGIPNGGQMPLFAHLSTSERRSLALYLISLRSPTP